ncbi:hypothetical protein [uncultured Faecalibaculum sp.]|uniref:hypothetical protein n=1 Tax=uncultured Faecalibaculum sp. TaxID=1729681 RepID=UPI002609DE12|nr:hypothetical protein [uncultured Faecalibaculum sp.]
MKSMVSVVCVVCLSSLYTGFFEQTAILRRVKQLHIPPILYALLTCSLACSQTLALVLSAQLLSGQYRNREELAITLEDTVVPVAALVPWSIASLAPLSFLGMTPAWADHALVILSLCAPTVLVACHPWTSGAEKAPCASNRLCQTETGIPVFPLTADCRFCIRDADPHRIKLQEVFVQPGIFLSSAPLCISRCSIPMSAGMMILNLF